MAQRPTGVKKIRSSIEPHPFSSQASSGHSRPGSFRGREPARSRRGIRAAADEKIKKLDTLRGRTLINLFFENSTRTQSSFELAGKRMGADVVNM